MRAAFPRSRPTAGLGAVVLALAVVLAGCGGDSDDDAGSVTSAATATSPATATTADASDAGPSSTGAGSDAAGTTITAIETNFAIELSDRDLTAGTYTFEVVNEGSATHSLTIEGPGLDATTSEELQGGESTTFTVTLQAGEYEVYCPIGNHRSMGMDTTLTVS